MAETEIIARRRKWTPEEKAALLAEVEAEDGRVVVVRSPLMPPFQPGSRPCP